MANAKPTHLDLFSGIGGFAIAAQNCGYATIGFCEKEAYAQQVLKERFGAVLADATNEGCDRNDAPGNNARQKPAHCEQQRGGRNGGSSGRGCKPSLHGDIFTLNGADYFGVDLLTGGFPCQPFSVAGKRRGANDDRALWPQMLRVIAESKPRWLIGENVAGIVTLELDNILSDLETIGYTAWPLVIPACAVDARHRRDRVWIVANAAGGTRQREAQRQAGHASQRNQDVADAGCGRFIGASNGKDEQSGRAETRRGSEDVAHANGASSQGNERTERAGPERAVSGEPCQWRDEGAWFAESGMGRVAHGIPNRAHRLRGLGNAIVPQVAEEIIRAIAATEMNA